MAGVYSKKNTYHPRSNDSNGRRTPPLNTGVMISDRNNRLRRHEMDSSSTDYYRADNLARDYNNDEFPEFDSPRKATKRKKVYRKKIARNERNEILSGRVHYSYVSIGEKSLFIFSIILVGMILLLMVGKTAYTANIQNQINVTKANTAAIQKDIDSVNILIEESKSITNLENKAINEIGMKYPTSEDIVYLNDAEVNDAEMIAQAAREKMNE